VTAELLPIADADPDDAYEYYRAIDQTLANEFLAEFARAVDRISSFPNGWQRLNDAYRRCRLHRFPYGVL
jgi:toxin ParE2